ncbi:MAG: hypothetical protein ACJ8F1_20995 [Polyangia bacterium]
MHELGTREVLPEPILMLSLASTAMSEEAIMKKIQGVVVAALLAIWCFPAVSQAKSLAADPAPLPAAVTSTRAPVAAETTTTTAPATEATQLAQREQQSQNLQDYKGGAAVVYVGSGVLLVVIIVLLILLI